MLRARVCDPAGPRAWRAAAIVGALPLTVVALVLPLPVVPRIVAMLLGVAWLVLGRVVVPRLRPTSCSVELEEDAIRLRSAGVRGQRIAARDIRGASTAQLGDGFALGVVRYAEGDPPLWLQLGSREDLEGVRRALRIGHAGFGAIDWPPQRGIFHTTPTTLDSIAGIGWLVMILAVCLENAELALSLALFVVPLTLVAMALAAMIRPRRNAVSLTPTGVQTAVGGVVTVSTWSSVTDARVEGNTLLVMTDEGRATVPMREATPDEREHMAAQIRSGVQRARGEGPLPSGVPASLAVLVPRDEPTRAWLERIDATAASMAHGEGYRHAGIEERDLWSALESPDAPAPLRAAAARVLARVAPQQAGDRIARAVAAEHDRETQSRLRVALEEDVELAASELDRLGRV
jgi:hypothetical protein